MSAHSSFPMFSSFHVFSGRDAIVARPRVLRIGPGDAFAALAEGFDDFVHMPTHLIFLGLFYALAGLVLASLSSAGGALQLVFPLASGFAIVGPFVAIGLYQMSRRRERGLSAGARDAAAVVSSPALASIGALGLALFLLFAAWIGTAEALYAQLYGSQAPLTASAFLADALGSERGHELILIGGALGFVYAVIALVVSVVAFPLLLDRDVGLVAAVRTSIEVGAKNPLAVATWGLIVAALLALGSLPLFVGLAVVMPVLGHGTWRFYRRAIARDPALEVPIAETPAPRAPLGAPRSVLFPWPENDKAA